MDQNKRTRGELKQYFVKNALPTESHFAELIDSGLNQKDDGVVKPENGPLSLEAAGDAESSKESLHLYKDFNETDPAWKLNLNPRTDVTDAGSAKAGFNLSDGDDNSRLFIKQSDGKVGLGTLEPDATLHIQQGSPGQLDGGGFLTLGPTYGKNLVLDHFRIQARRQGVASELRLNPAGGHVGIGQFSPQAPLHIQGGGDAKLDSGGTLIIGSTEGANLVFDNNEIMARDNEQPATLYLQDHGGDLHLHRAKLGANNFKFLEDGHFFGAARNASGAQFRMFIGQTEPGVGWEQYSSAGIYIDIDTSEAGFTAAPFYFPTIHATGAGHWIAGGVTAIYHTEKDSFRIYLHYPGLTTQNAMDRGWYMVWLAVGV